MYAVSIYKGSQGFQGFVNNPVTQPLSQKYPSVMPFMSMGGGTQRTPTNADMFTNSRLQYMRATGSVKKVGMNTKYIAPIPSSMRTTIQKSIAIGKQPLYSTNNQTVQPLHDDIRAKRRARSGGSVAPKKKGAY